MFGFKNELDFLDYMYIIKSLSKRFFDSSIIVASENVKEHIEDVF